MQLLDLPCELLLLIGENLSVNDLSHVLRVNRHLSCLLSPHFYKLALEDVGSFSALEWAAIHGHASLADLVLSKGARADSPKRRRIFQTPLHLAVAHNHPDVIRVLVKHRVHPNAIDIEFGTPLHVAALNESQQVIKVLLELGADMASTGTQGGTPAHTSAFLGDIGSMRAFIDAGLDLSIKGRQGQTLLHAAIANKKGRMVEFLLEHGGEKIIDAQDSSGWTPLHLASYESSADEGIVKLLCYHGADTELVNNRGETPADLATRWRQIEGFF